MKESPATTDHLIRPSNRLRWGLLLLLTAAVAYGMGLNPFSGGRDWPEDYDQARRNSASTGRPLLIQFTMPGCTYCVRMEREVLRRPDVADSMSPFELVRVNAGYRDLFGLARSDP